MNSENDREKRNDGFFDEDDAMECDTVDLFQIALEQRIRASSDDYSDRPEDDEDSVDIFELARSSGFGYDDDDDEDEEYSDDEDDDEDEGYSDDEDDEDGEYSDDEDDEDGEYSDDDDDDEDEEYSDDDDEDDEEYSDDDDDDEDGEYSDDEDDDEDGDYSDDEDDDEDEEYSDDEDDEDEEYFNDDYDDGEYSDDEDDDEDWEYSDDEDDDEDEEYSDDEDEEYSDNDDDEDEEYSDNEDDDEDGEYSDDDDFDYYDYQKEGIMSGFVDINQFLINPMDDVVQANGDDYDSVDLFELAGKANDLPVNENHGAFYYWAKKKTAAGWMKFVVRCFAVLLLFTLVSGVLYFNGLLNLIDFKAAGDFVQYFNLSDTDYRMDDDGTVYSTPVYYNESTTIEGFDESMIDIPEKDVVNILLIGTDVRGGTYEDRGNTDSMILVSLNTRDKNIRLTSFMRDMYVDIPDREWQRLNAAYAYGGPQLLFDTLKRNFDVNVDLYVRVNFYNFRKIVDHLGGIDIELTEAEARYMNKYSEKYKTALVEPGWQHLDGYQALSYARCRKIDSDFNRTKRQRTVILAIVKEIRNCSPVELNSLLNVFLPMIQTNMSKMQILGLLTDGTRYLNSNIETLNIPIKNSWRAETINKRSVLCPNFELNKIAITAHIYSTYSLDVENTRYQSFDMPE